ncbi:MAG: TadE family type IV pilus minor pilin [Mycobacterium sp.]
MVVVLVLCVAGLTAISAQVRCIDAAREAARLAARGDDGNAVQAARSIAPADAVVDVQHDGGSVVATVSARSILLAGLTLRAVAVATIEPTAG